ncbi:MAG: glycosyltransferase family 2 protein [Bacteroidales bacterium]|nr:glycosyltransferase family 2 protein [Bacteroidales bacterium]
MNQEFPLVSIISINFNQSQMTCDMIESLKRITYPNIEIIIVDNGSPSDNPDIIEEKYPQIKLIKTGKNLGFAGGNNQGILEANGKYLLFLNNDTEVEPDFLEPLVYQLESDSSIGLVSPKIKFFFSEKKNTIQYAGSTGINPSTGRGEKIGSFQYDKGQYNDIRETQLGHGAAMMIPTTVIKEVGLMPDIFFLYYEEHDWCEKIKNGGYKVFYVGSSVVYHKESMSVGKNSPLRMYYMTRGRLLYTRRNTSGLTKLKALVFFTLLSVPKNSIKLLLEGENKLLIAFWAALKWHLTHHQVNIIPKLIDSDGKKRIIDDTTEPFVKFS